MEYLLSIIPKDVVNIIEEYSKDRTNYDRVVNQFEKRIINLIRGYCNECLKNQLYYRNNKLIYSVLKNNCSCESTINFKILRKSKYYDSYILFINRMVESDRYLKVNKF